MSGLGGAMLARATQRKAGGTRSSPLEARADRQVPLGIDTVRCSLHSLFRGSRRFQGREHLGDTVRVCSGHLP